ncbi:Olfactory Receptor 2G6 [Manis pentadactyla]|nr:Olfactory Receptor 2G6 [Manis pentadactyla]
MEQNNETSGGDFILLGFSDQPQLEVILFAVVLISYLLTLLGNTAIILVSCLDPKLHTPMYFFLTNLSFLDLCFTTSIVPQLLWNLKGPTKTITPTGCAVQLCVSLSLGSTECVLLTIMAFDRYVAVCRPLNYSTIMHPSFCKALAGIAWLSGVGNTLIQGTITLQLPRCGHHQLHHFLCEVPAMIKLACVDIHANEVQLFVATLVLLLLPMALILVSYGFIVQAVMKLKIMGTNKSSVKEDFILVGFSDQPSLEKNTLCGSFVDICFTTSIVPQLLWNLRGPAKTITALGCAVQLYVSLALGSTESVVLAVMAFDRYAAVCKPLHYAAVMNPQLCQAPAGLAWLSGKQMAKATEDPQVKRKDPPENSLKKSIGQCDKILFCNLTFGTPYRRKRKDLPEEEVREYGNYDPPDYNQHKHKGDFFTSWPLCGSHACVDIAPLTLFRGGGLENGTYSHNVTIESKKYILCPQIRIKEPGQGRVTAPCTVATYLCNITTTLNSSATYGPTPVCVSPPFFFLLSKQESTNIAELICSTGRCYLAECWNGTEYQLAVVIWVPRHVPFPGEASPHDFPLLLHCPKRDFGITAAIIAAVAVASAAAAVAAVALSSAIETAQTLNSVICDTATALQSQANINAHLCEGLLLVNQRVDSIQEETDMLLRLQHLPCQPIYKALCVTPVQFTDLQNLSRNLSNMFKGPWDDKFLAFSDDLRKQIFTLNST